MFDNYNSDWKMIYGIHRIATYDKKVRIFRYKLFNNVFYLKVISCSKCSFCDTHDETPPLYFMNTCLHKIHGTDLDYISGPATPGGLAPPPHFLCSKKKKGNQRKKKSFKAETIKRLSPRSNSYCLSHSRALPWLADNTFSVPWFLQFVIHFAGPVFCRKN